MEFIADLHIHSHFSMATSKQLRPEYLDYWARIKGIKVVGTGDFTHPGWLREMKEKLEPDGSGLFRLREDHKLPNIIRETPENAVRFLLTAEISNIYKKNGQVRKVHSVLMAPDFATAERLQQRLTSMNFNITSDGRPILGLDVRDLLEITLEANEDNYFIPAHIWTPWFSVFGSKSGFDSMEECFDDLTGHIQTVETGLSTDPPLNWMCSFLDRYTLVSNSDAHSPEKLGRNANLFRTDPTYHGIVDAMKTGDPEKFGGTFDMFPQEGKYHYDGHRKCGIRWDPAETLKHRGICPVCGKKITVGVVNRIVRLSDREDIFQKDNRLPYYSIIPLKEMLSEIEGVGEKSKKISRQYEQLIRKAGSEFNILHYLTPDEVSHAGGEVLAEAIRRMRNNEVIIHEGFDGQYGEIKVFQPDELRFVGSQESLFNASASFQRPAKRQLIHFDLAEYRRLENSSQVADQAAEEPARYGADEQGPLKGLNPEQKQATAHFEGPAAVVAGPGTGKTRVLTRRMAYLVDDKGIDPSHILAITFTNKAAGEMKERCRRLISSSDQASQMTVVTFHAFGYGFLHDHPGEAGRTASFSVIDGQEQQELIRELFGVGSREAGAMATSFSRIKHMEEAPESKDPEDKAPTNRIPQNKDPENQIADKNEKKKYHADKGSANEVEEKTRQAFDEYEKQLRDRDLFDLDDLIFQTVRVMENNPTLRHQIVSQYPWILVDEFQDINPMQYRLLRLLSQDNQTPNLFVIGDPNQAIYGFRGSSTRFISRFMEDHPGASQYTLHTSYRCPQNILRASGNVLHQKGLEGLSEGVKIKIAPQQTGKSEAEYIARTIESLSGGLRFFSMDSGITGGEGDEKIGSLSDFAILCRTKAQMRDIEKALRDHTIPYQSAVDESFFNHPLVQNVRRIIEYLENPDNPHLKATLSNISSPAKPPENILDELKQHEDLETRVHKALELLAGNNGSDDQAEISQKIKDLTPSFEQAADDFIRYFKLGAPGDAYQDNTEKVTLMTLHASKGLEFKCVFIAGVEDGLIPYSLFKNQQSDREEERRLLYVGMTRASSYLYLTHAKKRSIMGREKDMSRSPFLDQIEKELTEVAENTYQKKKQDDSQLKLF